MSWFPEQVLRDIHRIQIRTRHLVATELLGAYRSAFKGRGIELDEVRAFESGDETRHIDWNVTARMNHPFIKTFREERALTVMLIVDISASAQFGSGMRKKNAVMAEIGALLAFSAIENHDKIGLLLFSGDVEKYLPPNKGQRHALRVIRELYTAESRQPGTDLARALTFFGRLQKKPAVCFILSDFLTNDYAHDLKLASKRYDCIAVRVLDARELSIPSVALLRMRDLETEQELLIDTSDHTVQHHFKKASETLLDEQNRLFHSLRIGLIDIRTDAPYAPAIRQFFHSHKGKGR